MVRKINGKKKKKEEEKRGSRGVGRGGRELEREQGCRKRGAGKRILHPLPGLLISFYKLFSTPHYMYVTGMSTLLLLIIPPLIYISNSSVYLSRWENELRVEKIISSLSK